MVGFAGFGTVRPASVPAEGAGVCGVQQGWCPHHPSVEAAPADHPWNVHLNPALARGVLVHQPKVTPLVVARGGVPYVDTLHIRKSFDLKA